MKTERRMCFGTCVIGIGSSVRQVPGRAAASGHRTGRGLGTRANDTANPTFDVDGAESSRSDVAQQRSASAWVTTRGAPSSSVPDLCIRHGPDPVQQAIRASGVASQPAQTATFPATKPKHRRTAESRWTSTTSLGLRMLDCCRDVKRVEAAQWPWEPEPRRWETMMSKDREAHDPGQIFPSRRLPGGDVLRPQR